MERIFSIEHDHFELAIYCHTLAARQQQYRRMLAKRHIVQAGEIPQFFENSQYHFEWIFNANVEKAEVQHKLVAVNDAFRFSPKTRSLTGVINTGNDLGKLTLPICYWIDGKAHYERLELEIFPTKMDMQQDLAHIYQTLDHTYPLWRFNFANKTEQDAGKSQQRGDFTLFWLAYFQRLQQQFFRSLLLIQQAPHRRLQPNPLARSADRLKGRLSPALAQHIQNDLASGVTHKKYAINQKKLSIDTPENRFVKFVVNRYAQKLQHIIQHIETENSLSLHFKQQLHAWKKPLQQFQAQKFFNEIGDFQGMEKSSLVLQQKTGYHTLYAIWQELKYYLNALAANSTISMKNIAELYEIWCFLTLRNLLLELGFREIEQQRATLQQNDLFEMQLIDGQKSAFYFGHENGVRVRLLHEWAFTQKTRNIRTYWGEQRPDITLEVQLADNQRFIWLFDAKYRVNDENNQDLVPDDAINQMHRYRDALIYQNQSALKDKSRPVFGAFALYPGFFTQQSEPNPYQEMIDEVGIGAFACLPTENSDGTFWLKQFLREQLLAKQTTTQHSEMLFAQDASRIAQYGMQQALYRDLTLLASLGNPTSLASGIARNADYFARFRQGNAQFYHIPKSYFDSKYGDHIAKEIRFFAPSMLDEHGQKSISHVWQVKNVTLLPRNELNEWQAGSLSDSPELYYLFELGAPLRLPHSIGNVPADRFTPAMKLTHLASLLEHNDFMQISAVYHHFIEVEV